MQKAAIYVRVSTKKESQKDSPEHQSEACKEFCEKNGFHVVEVYEDKASGMSIDKRPDVQRLVLDARDDKFDVVVFANLSRFARKTYHFDTLMGRLVDICKKRVIGVEDGIDSHKEGNDFVTRILSMMAQKQSEQISISSRRGLKQSALKGNFTGAIAAFGYKKALIDGRKTLIIDEESATIVKMIFDLYVNHKMGEKAIVNYLNSPDVGIPSPRKKGAWGITTIQRILQNEVYIGRNVFCKYTTEESFNKETMDLLDSRKKLVQRKKEDWLTTEKKTHESIIDEEIFERATKIRQLRGGGTRGSHKQPVNVFRKIIFCKHCGFAMVTMSSKMRGKKYQYLMCSTRRRKGVTGCPNGKWIPYQEMRDELIKWVGQKINEQLNVDLYTDSVINHLKSQEKKTKNSENEIKKIQREIEQNRVGLFKLRKSHMLEEVDDAQYNFEKEMYEKEIEELEARLEKIQNEAIQQKDYEEERLRIRDALNELITFSNYEDVHKVQPILVRLIKEITVDSDGNIDVYTLLGKLA